MNVDDSPGRTHIPRDIGTGGLAGSKSHRDRLRGGFEFVARQLQYGAGREAYAILARQPRDEAARISVVRPVGRPEQRELHRRIVSQPIKQLTFDRLIVFGEEHRLAFAEGGSFREKARPDGAKLGDWRRLGTTRNRLSQCRIGRIKVGRQLHPRHVERFRRFMEAMPFAVFGEHVANIQLWQLQQIAQVLLELFPIESPYWPTTIDPDVGQVRVVNRPLKQLHQ